MDSRPRAFVATIAGTPAALAVSPMTTEKKASLWLLALTAIGIVYGDIGTSPLYAFSIALHATGNPIPTPADVLGIISLIFWAIMAMVSLKYVVFVLRADNDGEGGILALLSLVEPGQTAGSARLPIVVMLGVAGAALLYGDGMITPAISVLSAMEGLKLATPAAGHSLYLSPSQFWLSCSSSNGTGPQ